MHFHKSAAFDDKLPKFITSNHIKRIKAHPNIIAGINGLYWSIFLITNEKFICIYLVNQVYIIISNFWKITV